MQLTSCRDKSAQVKLKLSRFQGLEEKDLVWSFINKSLTEMSHDESEFQNVKHFWDAYFLVSGTEFKIFWRRKVYYHNKRLQVSQTFFSSGQTFEKGRWQQAQDRQDFVGSCMKNEDHSNQLLTSGVSLLVDQKHTAAFCLYVENQKQLFCLIV